MTWKFTKFIPDAADMEAKGIAWEQFRNFMLAHPVEGMNEAEEEIFLFNSGFVRGMAWMKDRLSGKLDGLPEVDEDQPQISEGTDVIVEVKVNTNEALFNKFRDMTYLVQNLSTMVQNEGTYVSLGEIAAYNSTFNEVIRKLQELKKEVNDAFALK